MGRDVDEDELIEHWTLVGKELTALAGKRGPTRLAFALPLKFHQRYGPAASSPSPSSTVSPTTSPTPTPSSPTYLNAVCSSPERIGQRLERPFGPGWPSSSGSTWEERVADYALVELGSGVAARVAAW